MNRDRFIELLRADRYTKEDLIQLEQLIVSYPWFALLRFMKLKAERQIGLENDPEEISKAAVFSGNRGHVYKWIHAEVEQGYETDGFIKSELEFLDDDLMSSNNSAAEDPFELMDTDEDSLEGDADSKAIPEKEETEMEEPEIEQDLVVPVIESIEDEATDDLLNETGEKQDEGAEEGLEIAPEPARIQEIELLLRNTVSSDSKVIQNKSNGLIEQFLQKDPGVIKADKETSLEGDVSQGSVKEDDSFITDTLAKIYVKQGLHAKAIYAYERLSLKYPEKSAYFAAQIEKIKNIPNI